MESYLNAPRPVALSAGDEALELRDVGAADLTPSDEPLGSFVTESDLDRMWADDMARRDREAARPAGYVDATCLGCGCLLYVEADARVGDVLCPGCERGGAALAAVEDGNDDPTPPGAAMPVPDYAAQAAGYGDAALIESIVIVDGGTAGGDWCALMGIHSEGQRAAFLAAAAAEVARRLERLAA